MPHQLPLTIRRRCAPQTVRCSRSGLWLEELGVRCKAALDEPMPSSYHLCHQSALRSWPWISCRVAEGRALRRHGNRTGIIYRGRQVPTLDPERTGDMRFGMRIYQPFLNLFSYSGERGFGFLGQIYSALSANSRPIRRLKALEITGQRRELAKDAEDPRSRSD